MASFDATASLGPWRDASRAATVSPIVRRVAALLSRALLVTLFAVFAWSNFSHWRETGAPAGLGTTLLEGWAAALFLVRRQTTDISLRPLAWIAAPVGSFAMLFARPVGGGLPELACELVQFGGLMVALASLGTLGRSFGIVAANRGVKTRGPYRLVRHPAYLGYLISYSGYVAENPSLLNVGLLCLSTAFQLVRIGLEEKLLREDGVYARYRERVRYKLVPLVY
jgi:protein-S-isoprenylcysteine O-methyltransferase Ste14